MNVLRYRAANGWGATCGVELLDLAPGVVGLALCEPPDHHGPSVTNNVEVAATLAARRLGLDPARTVCLEHYPAGEGGREAATWDYVRFAVETRRQRRNRRLPTRTGGRCARRTSGGRWPRPPASPTRNGRRAGFGDLDFPDELRGRIDGVVPADLPAGYGETDLLDLLVR